MDYHVETVEVSGEDLFCEPEMDQSRKYLVDRTINIRCEYTRISWVALCILSRNEYLFSEYYISLCILKHYNFVRLNDVR